VIAQQIQQLLDSPPDSSTAIRFLVPTYWRDIEEMIVRRDFAAPEPVAEVEVPGGTLAARLQSWEASAGRRSSGDGAEPVFFRPRARIGKIGSVAGRKVTFVSAESYHRLRLGHLHSVVGAYSILSPDKPLSSALQNRIDRVIAATYWQLYEGFLLPPGPLTAIARAAAESGGDRFVEFLETMRRQILTPDVPLRVAGEWRHHARVGFLRLGARGMITDRQASVGELFADLLFLQRGAMEDMLHAEAERRRGTPRWQTMHRLAVNEATEDGFGIALRSVLRPHPVLEHIPDSVRPLIEAHAFFRTPFYRQGLLTDAGADQQK
jgi:hypothetical protein